MGVSYHCMRVEDSQFGNDQDSVDRDAIEQAIHFHNQHLDIADERGQFVAYCNLGLAFGD